MNVLLLSATASAINVINSLYGWRDIHLYVADASVYASGLYRDGVTPLVIPPAGQRDDYRRALDLIIRERMIDILLPSSDKDVVAVYELLEDGWNPSVKMFRPPFRATATLSDKTNLIQRLAPLFPNNVPKTYSDMETALDNGINFPVVVKPSREGGTKGVAIVENRESLAFHVRQIMHLYGGNYVVQEYVPGGIGSVYVLLFLYDLTGKVVAEAAMVSSLTFMSWGGGGNAGALVDEPELLGLAKQMIEAAGGWRGPINVEFKRHEKTGRFMLIEANCRLSGYSYLTSMNGMNYPQAMISVLLGHEVPKISARPVEGVRNFVLGFREKLVPDWVNTFQNSDPMKQIKHGISDHQ